MSLLNLLLSVNNEGPAEDWSEMPLTFYHPGGSIPFKVTVHRSSLNWKREVPILKRVLGRGFEEWEPVRFAEENYDSGATFIYEGQSIQFKRESEENLNDSSSCRIYFEIEDNALCKGNLMSLYNFGKEIPDYGFYYIFNSNSTLLSCPEIYATKVGNYGLYGAFLYNGSIEKACSLDMITEAGDYAFQNMFKQCTMLKTGPKNLNLQEIKDYTCDSMFYGCTSLTNVPKIVATKVGSNGCHNMFYDCYDLKKAPSILPATELGDKCYENMFSNCTSMTNAPILPATELSEQCYASMFYGCTALVNAPDLPAESLPAKCYSMMFYNCTSMTEGPAELPAEAAPEQCYSRMFYNCTSLQKGPNLPATQLTTSCYENMFYGCTSMTTGPEELPAEYLPAKCYASMFYNCTSLVNAPEIFATSWESGTTAQVMRQMFNNCKALNWMKVHFTTWPSSTATMNWVGGVPATGTFVKPTALTETFNTRTIPTGWTVENF
jgi:hypothetical protein